MSNSNKNVIQVKPYTKEEIEKNTPNVEVVTSPFVHGKASAKVPGENNSSNVVVGIMSQCPFAYGQETNDSDKNSNSKENITKWKNAIADIRPIPHKRCGMWNFLKIKQKGYLYFEGLIKKYNSSIYRLRLNPDRIILNDHISISVLYDPEKVKKEIGFGFMKYNPLALQSYIPTIFSNGIEHKNKKTLILEYIKFVLQHITINKVVEMVETEFQNMPSYNELTKKESIKLDFEDIFDKAVCNVITKIILGNTVDHHILEEWLSKSLEFQYGIDHTDSQEKKVTSKVFELIQACEYIKQIDNIVSITKTNHIDIVKEIIWMTCFNAFGGIKPIIISSLLSFIRLPMLEKNLLVQESTHFFKLENRSFKDLYELHYMNSFFLEVIRLHPSAIKVYRRMSEQHMLESTTGRYNINKDELLCGNLYSVHRDPTIYDNPNQFSLHRPKKLVTKHNYTFGGTYEQEAKPDNFKCPGQNISEIIIKVFSMFVTRCTIVPIETPVYTGKNMSRLEGSDSPLRIKTFCYNNETNE